jgi:tyrosyl-tRNA synthetase
MNFIEELRWRGMLHDLTPGIEEVLSSKGSVIGYIGFDPTAPSMTIGNFVQIQLLKLFQLSGHKPIVLMGGATGRIGDPSFKDKERELKSGDELDRNLAFQLEQVKKFIDFDGTNAAMIVNNLDFYSSMNVLDFLRDVGKTLTVNYMMSKDSVKNRAETGLSFTEFSYQLLQAYDFQVLYEKYGCILQMGGSDQWGNITSGTEFIRRNSEGKAYAITTPLLTKADGKKFGKSEEGNIWLDPKLTSPYKFYQFWINADDLDIPKYLRYFSLKDEATILALESEYASDPRKLKEILAAELSTRVHGSESVESIKQVINLLFSKEVDKEYVLKLSKESFELISQELTTYEINFSSESFSILELVAELTPIFSSKSEARRAIQNNALSVNKVKVQSDDLLINDTDFVFGQFLLLENGKKNKVLINRLS